MSASSSLPEAPPQRPTDSAGSEQRPQRKQRGKLWKESLNWTRILHVYTSMIALVLVLFFALTGITLNHPEWTFGFEGTTSTASGDLPADWIDGSGTINFLGISEFLRAEHDVRGAVDDFGTDTDEGFIAYKGPGYGATAFFDTSDGTYELAVEQDGLIAVMNDLHKGRDTGASWSWLIDLSGGFLAFLSLTGLTLQLFLAKRRRAAMWTVAAGLAITVVLWWIAVS